MSRMYISYHSKLLTYTGTPPRAVHPRSRLSLRLPSVASIVCEDQKMVEKAKDLRELIRIKIEDDNDLKLVKQALE